MNQSKRRAASAALLLALFVLIGCDKPAPKPAVPVPVSGTVTFDGKPLTEGTVYFRTVETGAFEALPVKDGKFEGIAEVGERRVEINSYRIRPMKDDPMGGDIKENVIHARYNADSTITATVTADGPNAFKFDVKSK